MTHLFETIKQKKIHTLLLDLDATLLPFRQADLSEAYFGDLHNYAVARLGETDAARFDKAAMTAFRAMKKNDGSRENINLFRDAFYQLFSDFPEDIEAFYEAFYRGPFAEVRRVLQPRGGERALLRLLRQKGYRLVCATNPVFPMSANAARMEWADLAPEDFDHVTNHDGYRFCKPAPGYFIAAAAAVGSRPEACLMVGNDTLDDLGAEDAGMEVVLITDYLHVRGDRTPAPSQLMGWDTFVQLCASLPDAPTDM